MPLVEMAGLGKIYPSGAALQDLTLVIPRGLTYGFVGPDGAGKTTLLRLLCGILRPSAGALGVLGVDVRRHPERVKPRLGYMAQRFALYRDLTVLENLRFFTELFGAPGKEAAARLERLLRLAQLWEFRHRLARNLSGGMRQKLALCCTLIHTPELLILDEPTTGVDPVSRHEFWALLRELPAQGTSIIVTTGYLDEAERCDRVALLHAGHLLVEGTPDELRASLGSRPFEVHCGRLREARDALLALPGVRDVQLFGDRLHLFYRGGEPEAVPARIETRLAEKGLGPSQVREIPPRLEDVFMEQLAQGGIRN